MFLCESEDCGVTVPQRTPENKVVLKTRHQVYSNEILKGKERGKYKRTEGTEIIREISVCPGCYKELTGEAPAAARPAKPPTITEDLTPARRPYKKKPWKNPRRKGKHADKQTERKKPIVEVVNRLPAKDAK